MAHEARVHPEHRLGVVRFSGDVNGSGLLQAMAALYVDEGWVPDFGVAWDGRAIAHLDLRPEDGDRVVKLAGRFPALFEGGPTAILVGAEPDARAAEALIRRLAEGLALDARVFREGGAAAAWLGVPRELLESASS